MPLSGGPERKVFEGPPVGYQNYWTLSNNTLYSLTERNGHFEIERIDPETGMGRSIHVLRQDPDVILVGEMRDPETIATAITAAEIVASVIPSEFLRTTLLSIRPHLRIGQFVVSEAGPVSDGVGSPG